METYMRKPVQSILMVGMLLSFLGVTCLCMIYMAKDNNYNNTIFHYFSISKPLYSKLMYLDIRKDTLINGMNLCGILFVLFNYAFSQHNFPYKGKRSHTIVRVLLIASLTLQFLIYSTWFQYFVYFGHAGFIPDAATYRSAYALFHHITVILNFLVLVYSAGCLLVTARKREPMRTLRNIKWLVFILDICICVLYFYMFFSLPDSFLWMSRSVGYIAYTSLKMAPYFGIMRVVPLVVVIPILMLWCNFHWYNKDLQRMKDDDYVFSSIVASSEISTRALSHYIKNELLGIQAETEFMLQAGRFSPEGLEHIRTSCTQVYERLDSLQRNSNRLVLNQSRSNIVDILEKSLERSKELFQQRQVTFAFSTDQQEIYVFCDRQCMQEVFSNLINNAVEAMEAMPDDRRRHLDVSVRLFETEVQIQFQDSGPGISRSIQNDLFQPFSSTKPTKYNWGIGLSFSKRIIKSHNGRIEAENAPEGGACFTLQLPIIK